MDNLLQDITIYHKDGTQYVRYNKIASVRNTSYLNRNKTGVQTTDNALIRVFDTKGYNNTWKCQKGDIIVSKKVLDDIIKAPLTELREKYGKDYAVYTGDYIFTKCFEILAENYELHHMKELSKGVSRVCVGEIEQFDGRFKSHTSVKKYLKIVGAKTSALLATSLAVGAYEAGCDERFCKKLGKIGLHVWNAFQIIDDILDYTGDEARVGKTLGNDLKQGYYTLPLIYALRKNDLVLNKLLAADVYDDETIKRIIVRVNELGGVRQAQSLAEKYTIKSLKEISSLPTCQSRDDLEWITKRLLVREH